MYNIYTIHFKNMRSERSRAIFFVCPSFEKVCKYLGSCYSAF